MDVHYFNKMIFCNFFDKIESIICLLMLIILVSNFLRAHQGLLIAQTYNLFKLKKNNLSLFQSYVYVSVTFSHSFD